MAAPQFFTPPRVTPSRPKRRFTLEQANRTLPLVKRIVTDIVQCHKAVTVQQEQLQQVSPNSKIRTEAERAVERSIERLNQLLEELSNVGCEMKDFQMGLTDFIGRHQGRDVCLCWKLGEASIGYWHEMDAGFGGRQPIATLDERE
ncbi:MAG TPA: DUF2203 domain-containing protein [Tepidisphaeraceae bacterium]|nr:DUF2203 domain-containing protein [Tepidisphaeraceae bacterium]